MVVLQELGALALVAAWCGAAVALAFLVLRAFAQEVHPSRKRRQ